MPNLSHIDKKREPAGHTASGQRLCEESRSLVENLGDSVLIAAIAVALLVASGALAGLVYARHGAGPLGPTLAERASHSASLLHLAKKLGQSAGAVFVPRLVRTPENGIHTAGLSLQPLRYPLDLKLPQSGRILPPLRHGSWSQPESCGKSARPVEVVDSLFGSHASC